jgi:hypothetical protein
VDGTEQLLDQLTKLFNLNNTQKRYLNNGTWQRLSLSTKTRAKKGYKNCRLIATLCSMSKIFEKLILERILELKMKTAFISLV